MPTNLAIDDNLLNEALSVGGMRTKKDTVSTALQEFIERRQQKEILRAMGTINFRKGWDHKKGRRDRASTR